MSSSSSADRGTLALTAVVAAIGGAAITVGLLHLQERRRQQNQQHPQQQLHRSLPSVIFSPDESKLMPHQHEEKMIRQIAARAIVEEDNLRPRDSVTVRVPASSANMGPGCTFVFVFCCDGWLVDSFAGL